MDAYKLLFNSSNYYVCKSVERSVIDLYIKARILTICKDPEKVAKTLIEERKIYKKDVLGEGKGTMTDTGLCRHFDKIDNTYYSDDKNTKVGLFEHRYQETSEYIHPNVPSIWSYTTDDLGDWTGLIENDRIQFNDLISRLMLVLRRIFEIIQEAQKHQ